DGKANISIGDRPTSDRLSKIFREAIALNEAALTKLRGYNFTTKLEFPQDWGLGSSSTLISLLAQWLEVDPFLLLQNTFGGSGYDIACAQAMGPLTYQLKEKQAVWQEIEWSPEWVKDTYFVHRNKKQNSREGIQQYRKNPVNYSAIQEISEITAAIQKARQPAEVLDLLHRHEAITGQLVNQIPIQQQHFSDFPGVVKSLGAWGGDFAWAIPIDPTFNTLAYFADRGFSTIIQWEEMTRLPTAYSGQTRKLHRQRSPTLDR
ncbi:MAG: GYDIA family GHMP kinase, partial [Bacteroidota bacterium]